jgi:4-alpha-glucanotransferase
MEFLAKAGQALWQILPLGPTGFGNSPYSSYSAFAGNPLLLDLDTLVAEGDLESAALPQDLPDEWVDFSALESVKFSLLRRAAESFLAGGDSPRKEEFRHFCHSTFWLDDFSLFMALKDYFSGKNWNLWPDSLARRTPEALEEYADKLGDGIGAYKYMQWQFFRQWTKLKAHANDLGIEIIGDMPIFVAYDSADVWANRGLFKLDGEGKMVVVAGVPPDYFSRTGQLWGNPLYDWERVGADGYSWWIARVANDLRRYDMLRIDHFRGFEACWEVPAREHTAANGCWIKGPGEGFFQALRDALGTLPIIAEDLGVITPEVEALRDRFGFPGMKILQFAFGSGADNPYLPHNMVHNSVVYTGTHDNDTTAGWFAGLSSREKKGVLAYLHADGRDIAGDLVRAAFMSVADTCIVPLQDLLSLDSSARMNVPGVAHGNWNWRCSAELLDAGQALRLLELTELYGRRIC